MSSTGPRADVPSFLLSDLFGLFDFFLAIIKLGIKKLSCQFPTVKHQHNLISTCVWQPQGIYTTNASISLRRAKILCRELAKLLDVRLPGC